MACVTLSLKTIFVFWLTNIVRFLIPATSASFFFGGPPPPRWRCVVLVTAPMLIKDLTYKAIGIRELAAG